MSSQILQPGDQVICINKELHYRIPLDCYDLFVKESYPENKTILVDIGGIDVIFNEIDFRKVENI